MARKQKQKRSPWTTAELTLLENHANEGIDALSKLLPKHSMQSIRSTASRNGISIARVNRELRLRNLGIETEEQRIADLDKQINTLYQDNSRLRKSKPQRSNMGADQRKHKEGST